MYNIVRTNSNISHSFKHRKRIKEKETKKIVEGRRRSDSKAKRSRQCFRKLSYEVGHPNRMSSFHYSVPLTRKFSVLRAELVYRNVTQFQSDVILKTVVKFLGELRDLDLSGFKKYMTVVQMYARGMQLLYLHYIEIFVEHIFII